MQFFVPGFAHRNEAHGSVCPQEDRDGNRPHAVFLPYGGIAIVDERQIQAVTAKIFPGVVALVREGDQPDTIAVGRPHFRKGGKFVDTRLAVARPKIDQNGSPGKFGERRATRAEVEAKVRRQRVEAHAGESGCGGVPTRIRADRQQSAKESSRECYAEAATLRDRMTVMYSERMNPKNTTFATSASQSGMMFTTPNAGTMTLAMNAHTSNP